VQGVLSEAEAEARSGELTRRAAREPSWLLWRPAATLGWSGGVGALGAPEPMGTGPAAPAGARSADERELARVAAIARPRVLARFDNDAPFLVERTIGLGSTTLVTTSLLSSWNTLAASNAMFVMDKLVRTRIERTLPPRAVATDQPWRVPINPRSLPARLVLTRPDGRQEPLEFDAGDGVRIDDLSQRGVYQVTAFGPEAGEQAGAPRAAPLVVAAHGPEEESVLAPLADEDFQSQWPSMPRHVRCVGQDEEIQVQGAARAGQDLWPWLAGAVLVCLAAEMVALAASSRSIRRAGGIGRGARSEAGV
jgi:hypothetical protein